MLDFGKIAAGTTQPVSGVAQQESLPQPGLPNPFATPQPNTGFQPPVANTQIAQGFDPEKDVLADGELPAGLSCVARVGKIELKPNLKTPGTFNLLLDVQLMSPIEVNDAAGARTRVAGRKAKLYLDVNFQAQSLGPSWKRANDGLKVLGFPVTGVRPSAAAYVAEVVQWIQGKLINTQFPILIDGTEPVFATEPQTAQEMAQNLPPKTKIDPATGQPIKLGDRLKMLSWNKIQGPAVLAQ